MRSSKSLPLALAACLISLWLAAPAKGEEEGPDGGRKPVAELRRELLEWRKVVDDRTLEFEERQAAGERIAAIDDPRMTPILSQLWDREKEVRVSSSRRHLVKALQAIAEGGDRDAFLTVVRASILDTHADIRRDAAIWIGTQENRADAIPTFVKYLNTRKYAKPALTSLGYTQIPQNPTGPPDPDLVAAMINGLVDVIPVRMQVLVPYSSRVGPYRTPRGTAGAWGTKRVAVTEYVQERNPDVHELLFQYTAQYTDQDFGYHQEMWRNAVLQPLRERKRNMPHDEQQAEQ